MDRNTVNWRGYWAASPTPFTEAGEIDEPTMRALIEYYLDQGVHGLLINGSTGEWFSQSPAERDRVAEIAVSQVASRVPVVVGCTEFTAEGVIRLALGAETAGASGVMMTPPPYVRPTQAEIMAFYSDISAGTELPMMIYNIPRRAAIEIETKTLKKLAEITNVVALKNSAKDPEFFDALDAVGETLRVFGGNLLSDVGVDRLALGQGDGYIGGWQLLGNKLPELFEAVWRDDLDSARKLAAQEKSLDVLLWDDTNAPKFGASFQAQMKAALLLMGIDAGYPRRPLLALTDPKELEGLAAVLTSAGISVTQTA